MAAKITVTMRHTGDTMRFAKYSSDDSEDAFKKGEPVVKAWVPFDEFDRGIPPSELEVELS